MSRNRGTSKSASAGEREVGASRASLLAPLFDALATPVTVLDDAGAIVLVNEAWRLSGADASVASAAVAERARAVMGGRVEEASVEYACAGERERHFVARIRPVPSGGRVYAAVAHEEVTERKRAEEARRASEARFQSLIDSALDVITIVDGEGRILYESPSAERILGYPAAARVGKSFFDLIHADDLPRVIAGISGTLERAERKSTLEYRFRRGDGAWRTIEGTAKNLLAEPSVGGIVLNCREITERKLAEEAQARLAAVLDWTPNFVSIADPHGRLLYVNRATRQLIGLGEGVLPDQLNLTDLHPQWVSDRLLHEGIPVAMREGVWSGETAVLDVNSHEIPVLQAILAHRVPGRGVEFFSTIAHDITERKQNEETLRESDEIFRQIAENISETLWIFDLDRGRPVYVSPGYERIWGRSVESAYSDPAAFLSCISPAERTLASAPSSQRSRGREEEFRIQRTDGSPRWVRGRSAALDDLLRTG